MTYNELGNQILVSHLIYKGVQKWIIHYYEDSTLFELPFIYIRVTHYYKTALLRHCIKDVLEKSSSSKTL